MAPTLLNQTSMAQSKLVLAFLYELCDRIDRGKPLIPYGLRVATPIALATGLWGAAALSHEPDSGVDGAPIEDIELICDDLYDNDEDGYADCDDEDCADLDECLYMTGVPMYGAFGCYAPAGRRSLNTRLMPIITGRR